MIFNRAPEYHATVASQPSELTLTAAKWLNGCTGSDRAFKNFKNGSGAASLEDMALRCFVRSRGDLEEGTLEFVPWMTVGKRIWEVCVRHDLISVALWKHFASAYSQEHPWPGNPNEKLAYQAPTIPPELLPELIPSLESPRGLLLTSLTLRNIELNRADWVSGLSRLANLAILQVHRCPGFSNQVVRGWSDRAVQNSEFAHLRILEVVDEKDEFTFESLKFISQLTALQVCQLSGRTFTPKCLLEAGRHGWKRLCEHGNENIHLSFNNDIVWYNSKRLCPQSCKKAQDLFISLQESLSLPLLKARCTPRTVDWATPPKPRFVATIVPNASPKSSAKRGLELELAAESSRQAPVKKKPALRQGAKRDATDLFKQFTGS